MCRPTTIGNGSPTTRPEVGNPESTRGSTVHCSSPSLPYSEQRAIAAVLTDVDELIGSLEALIAKKRAIKQAAMQELLTGSTRLPGFGGEWEMKRISELAKVDILRT